MLYSARILLHTRPPSWCLRPNPAPQSNKTKKAHSATPECEGTDSTPQRHCKCLHLTGPPPCLPFCSPLPRFLHLECKMVQEVQHEEDTAYDPRQFQHGDFVPARRHARQSRRGAFQRRAEGGEGFAL